MKIHIPDIGDTLILTSDWTFSLYYEHRNSDLWEHFFNKKFSYGNTEEHETVKLETGSKLTVDRIYIRKGTKDFSSVSFLLDILEKKRPFGEKGMRFWAKLEDVNRMEAAVDITLDTAIPIRWECFESPNSVSITRNRDDFEKELTNDEVSKIVCYESLFWAFPTIDRKILCYVNKNIKFMCGTH